LRPYNFFKNGEKSRPPLDGRDVVVTIRDMKTSREYRVEGHSTDTLQMFGGVATATDPYHAPWLTREGAWSTVQYLARIGKVHTIKVYKGGTVVYRAFKQVGGEYIDAKTGKPVNQ
jgi:hypothetical protein